MFRGRKAHNQSLSRVTFSGDAAQTVFIKSVKSSHIPKRPRTIFPHNHFHSESENGQNPAPN